MLAADTAGSGVWAGRGAACGWPLADAESPSLQVKRMLTVTDAMHIAASAAETAGRVAHVPPGLAA